MSKSHSEWICGLQYDWCLHSLLSSSVLLIVLFIVCLCWLMAQGYVRREERLPKVQAGHAVNPSTQSYWLTEVPPQCCYNAHTQPRTHKHKLPFKTHFPQSVHLLSHEHSPFLTWCVCLTFCQVVYQEHPLHNLCVCVYVCSLRAFSLVPLSCYHSLCLFSMCSVWTPCWFYPSVAVWGSLCELFLFYSSSVNSFFLNNLYTNGAWATRHASVCVSTLS